MADKTFHSIKFPGLSDTYKIPDIVNEYSPSSAYAVGDYVLKDGKTYKCTSAIASSGEPWNTAHWTEVKVGNDLQGEVADLKSDLNDKLDNTFSALDAGKTLVVDANGNVIADNIGGITKAIKNALLDIFEHVAYVGVDGQTYYDALEAALQTSEDIERITAVFNPDGETFYDTDSIDVLKDYLTVTAYDINGRSKTVTDYSLSGNMTAGTNVITVRYAGKSATFSATVLWGYKLRETFVSTGTNRIDTTKQIDIGSYTIAIEFLIKTFTLNTTKFIIGNDVTGYYLSLQCNQRHENSSLVPYMWGIGIPWSNGRNLVSDNHRIRAVVIFNRTASAVECTIKFKDVTAGGAVKSFTSSYPHGSLVYSYNIVLGNIANDLGFDGMIYDTVFENRIWTNEEITAYLG